MTSTPEEPMRPGPSQPASAEVRSLVSCAGMWLLTLVRRVVQMGDRHALNTILASRAIFRLGGNRPMPFVEFIESMKEIAWARRWVRDSIALDRAGDLVRDRFSLVSDLSPNEDGKRARGPDGRLYLRAFLEFWETYRSDHPDLSPLQEETHAARLLQLWVTRHFRFSCSDAGRTSNPTRSRYAWRVDGQVIYLLMPTRLSGTERRRWLEQHIDAVDPRRPGERERIQGIVDAYLGVAHILSMDDLAAEVPDRPSYVGTSSLEGQAGEAIFDLPRYVAREKAENIERQRPAIRALGPEALEAMVLEIFRCIENNCYDQAAIAQRFGTSKSNVNRFAAKKWEAAKRIPDLYVNIARVLAARPPFVEAAKQMRIWEKVEAVLRKSQRSQSRRSRRV